MDLPQEKLASLPKGDSTPHEMSQQTQYIRAKNQTGATIQQGFVTHATGDYGIQTISISNLANNAATPAIVMPTGPSSKDYWWIGWTNDGKNWVTWAGTDGIHDHESPEAPGTVAMVGKLGQGDLAIWFTVDGDKTDKESIDNPW
jgi:hypothetical protein